MNIIDLPCSLIAELSNNIQNFIGQTDNSSRPNPRPISNYSVCELSYHTFLHEHMIKNTPCTIRAVTREWPASKWILGDKPNLDYLSKCYGNVSSVPVANCGDKYFNAQRKEDIPLKQYLEYWESLVAKHYSSELPCLYLKDWHFTRDFPEETVYTVPECFASDWLNEYFTAREDVKDDYRFVYMGPKGSWTPFHADVFSSFSWSVNICGKKRWVLFPPGQEQYLRDKQGNLVYDIESPDLKNSEIFEHYTGLESPYEVVQQPGEAVFIPSGWHHQVWNLEDTISINHNWVNGCNIGKVWKSMKDNLAAVQAEIADCRDMDDWEEHCQVMLNATFGLDYKQFCRFLLFIVHVRLKHLVENTPLEVYGGWLIGKNHLKFDLIQAKTIMFELFSDSDFKKLPYYLEVESEIRSVLKEINSVMDRK